LVTIGHTGR